MRKILRLSAFLALMILLFTCGKSKSLRSINVIPEHPSLPSGTIQQFSAMGVFSDKTTQDITAQVSWSSSALSNALIDNSGIVICSDVGKTTITAESGAVSGSTELTVTNAVFPSLMVTPMNPYLHQGDSQQFTAEEIFTDGTATEVTSQVTWSSSREAVASIGGSGKVSTGSPGTTIIMATHGNIAAATTLTVAPRINTASLSGKYEVLYPYTEYYPGQGDRSGRIAIYFIGDFTPGIAVSDASRSDRLRELALSFIMEEAGVFGISDRNELKEAVFTTDSHGVTHIRYQRYIADLPLDGMDILVHISPNGRITSFSAGIVYVTEESYKAAVKETLNKETVLDIIETDMGNKNISEFAHAEKASLAIPPYVIWSVSTNGWLYRIDAFSGKILSKRSTWIE